MAIISHEPWGSTPARMQSGAESRESAGYLRIADQVLALSDERDQWAAYAMQIAAVAYAAGFADGRHSAAAAWPILPPLPDLDAPPLDELAARRASHGDLCACGECRS